MRSGEWTGAGRALLWAGVVAAIVVSIGGAGAAGASQGVLDIDDNGQCDALTDGLLVVRHLFGFTGTSLTTQAIGGGATRTTDSAISSYLASIGQFLDVDGNGGGLFWVTVDGYQAQCGAFKLTFSLN